jgi:hypothetical protein
MPVSLFGYVLNRLIESDSYNSKSENFLLTFLPPHPSPLPAGEREGVRGNFKYLWLELIVVNTPIDARNPERKLEKRASINES